MLVLYWVQEGNDRRRHTRRQVAKRSSTVDDIREPSRVGIGPELPPVGNDGVEGVIVGGFGDVD